MILAIDTSTRQAGLALARDGQLLAEAAWTAGSNHSRWLTPMIERMLALESLEIGSLSAVVVASGPGSFSGLRVGISESMGLATALEVPVVGVSTLDAIGLQAACLAPKVSAVLPAGRGQVYMATYEGGWETFSRVSDYTVMDIAGAAELADGLIAGEAAPDVLDVSNRPDAWMAPAPFALRRAGYLAELGGRYLLAGGRDQRSELEPLYLRRSAAEEKRMGSSH